jgi:hypothetical protein
MRQALAHYQPNGDVFAIGGYQPLRWQHFRCDPSPVMSTWRFTCWGWATWSDRWKALRPYREGFAELFDYLTDVPDCAGSDLQGMAQAVSTGHLATWDVQVSIAMLWVRQVMLLPTRGLVRNIGLAEGTHGGGDYHPFHNRNVWEGGWIDCPTWLDDVMPRDRYVRPLQELIQRLQQPELFTRGRRRVSSILRRLGWSSSDFRADHNE